MESYLYTDTQTNSFDAILTILRDHAGVYLDPYSIYPLLGIGDQQYEHQADIRDGLKKLEKHRLVVSNDAGHPMIHAQGISFLKAGGFTRQRKAFYAYLRGDENVSFPKEEFQALQIQDLNQRLAKLEWKLRSQQNAFETWRRKQRKQTYMMLVVLCLLLVALVLLRLG